MKMSKNPLFNFLVISLAYNLGASIGYMLIDNMTASLEQDKGKLSVGVKAAGSLTYPPESVDLEKEHTEPPTVEVSQGRLSGLWMRSRGGRRVAAFKGVPYAKPPVGDLRFESPKPAKPWFTTYNATNEGSECVQFDPTRGAIGQEDCLFLNIFTPNVKPSVNLPVLFFIHGGGFKTGSSSPSVWQAPDYLLDEDILLVTPNYRLGVLGFLSLEDAALPGNLGLKDQREALRWVRDNIAQFGGDPARVTIAGQSAGSQSVHYHMLFNTDEGLFRAGICDSGTAYAFGFQWPGDQQPLVNYLVEQNYCGSDKASAIVECLRKVDSYELERQVESFWPPADKLVWKEELAPVIEPKCVADAFVTENPWNRNTSLPLLISTNKDESLFILLDILKDETDKKFEYYNKNYEQILPYDLVFDTSAIDPVSVAKQIKSFYFQNNNIDRAHAVKLIELLTDGMFNYGTTEVVKRNQNQSFLYSFEYLGSKSLTSSYGYNNSFGPCHADDLIYLFPLDFLGPLNDSEADFVMSKQLVKMWTSFVIHLTPLLEDERTVWEPASPLSLKCLHIIGPDNFVINSEFFNDRMNFWRNLPLRNKPLSISQLCDETLHIPQ